MSLVSYLYEKDIARYNNIMKVSKLNSVEDVSTLIDVFEQARGEEDFTKFKYVVKDDEDFYYMVVSDKKEDFDLFNFINNAYSSDILVSCVNAKQLFPKDLSRGIYDDDFEDEVSTSEQDVPTDFLDKKELPIVKKGVLHLVSVRNSSKIVIPEGGVIIGRSSKKVDYLVKENTNVGRVHCKVYFDKNKLMVHDCNSLNGTFVNNIKVREDKDMELVEGDVLTLADEEFRVKL